MPGLGNNPPYKTQARPWIRFALPAMVECLDGSRLTSGLPRPNARLEQFQNTSSWIDNAAALPVSMATSARKGICGTPISIARSYRFAPDPISDLLRRV
jgi:hypothetical protein